MKTEIGELSEISRFSDQISASFPFGGGGLFDQFPIDGGERNTPFGFMELLGIQDFADNSLFDLPPPTPVSLPPESSEVLNLPATPNESSISSSSAEAPNEPDPAKGADGDDPEKETKPKWRKGEGGSEKGQKRKRGARVAFLTRSEVDHLEDGYRWRKYGQKAVKDSPFPRSYYRCTTTMCGVKKRVERSFNDPTVVITTYEGQHTHPSPAGPRGSSHHLVQYHHHPPPMADRFGAPQVQHLPYFDSYMPLSLPPPQPLGLRRYCDPATAAAGISIQDHGLLQDLIPSRIWKIEDQMYNHEST